MFSSAPTAHTLATMATTEEPILVAMLRVLADEIGRGGMTPPVSAWYDAIGAELAQRAQARKAHLLRDGRRGGA